MEIAVFIVTTDNYTKRRTTEDYHAPASPPRSLP